MTLAETLRQHCLLSVSLCNVGILLEKVCTRSAHAAVSKVSADAVLKKVLNVRRTKAGEFLKDVRAIKLS